MTRVLPLPAPARISTGPWMVLTASRCWGLRSSRNDKVLTTLFIANFRVAIADGEARFLASLGTTGFKLAAAIEKLAIGNSYQLLVFTVSRTALHSAQGHTSRRNCQE